MNYLRPMQLSDEYFMQQALKEAQIAFEEDEVPVGAVLVINQKIIARGHNQVERLNDSTAHAEILTLTSAYSHLGTKYLPDASLYVTVEPCLMCAGAVYWGKLARIIFGTPDPKNGYKHITEENSPFHPKKELSFGMLQDECAALMKEFFKSKR